MTGSFSPQIRSDLAAETPYGAPQLSVPVSLNVNENTHPLPPEFLNRLLENLQAEFSTLNRYPDREFLALRGQMADYLGYGLTADQVWAANGSNETLQQILLAFGGTENSLLSFSPSYSMYSNLAKITATKFIEESRGTDFSLSPTQVAEAIRIHRPSITVICNPNNPTGTLIDLDVIRKAAEASAGLVVVDEAYIEFSESPSAIGLISEYSNLVVSRTMSKAFSFAGVRVGYLAADEKVVNALRIVRLPYHLSALTQAAASTAFEFSEAMLESVMDIRQERSRLTAELEKFGLNPYPSDANFLLVGGFLDSNSAFEFLLERGVLIRNVAIAGTLRITIGTANENNQLLAALELYLSETGEN